ncbi:MAG: UDP-N-acetylmuramoyl-L-alanyl-D-glutamate--2,6-diaminopimelate ligase [Sphaerochaeta sp.]|nr:UDP-N-acetylmuramoyl-L-alanyl-D-glutamate--2,6-diaminopimelate ligase [Sphaerochaeta sp.]
MKTLRTLLSAIGINDTSVPDTQTIEQICQHSQRCKPFSVFFAFKGLRTDGSHYINDAIEHGAICIIAEESTLRPRLPASVHYYTVKHPHTAFALMCSAFYDYPQRQLVIVGVSGTDGKSTTSDYLYQILQRQGIKAGLLTTVNMDDGSGKQESPFRQSTPEADQLQEFLYRCTQNGATHVILECTSHALSKTFDRLGGIEFSAAIITKVTSEHLEFHHSLEEYTNAKVNLVRALKENGILVTSTDNPRISAFSEALTPTQKAIILGLDVPMRIEFMGYQGVVVEILGKRIHTPLLLPSLATNALLAVFCAADLLHKPAEDLLPLIEQIEPVKGRMQLIENALGVRAIIDFAHTVDAYEGIFFFANRTSEGGNLIAVFGSAGERDTTKRSPMGKIANRYCSTIILTEEDPRYEGNQVIFSDLRFLMHNSACTVLEIEDRREAIKKAVSIAQTGDTILFLGKGHEKTIERESEKIPWDEITEVKHALRAEEQRRQCK